MKEYNIFKIFFIVMVPALFICVAIKDYDMIGLSASFMVMSCVLWGLTEDYKTW